MEPSINFLTFILQPQICAENDTTLRKGIRNKTSFRLRLRTRHSPIENTWNNYIILRSGNIYEARGKAN